MIRIAAEVGTLPPVPEYEMVIGSCAEELVGNLNLMAQSGWRPLHPPFYVGGEITAWYWPVVKGGDS